MNIKGKLYRLIMGFAHTYHWHYAPPIYPDGDMQLWCKWCGFRQTIHRRGEDELSLIGFSSTGRIEAGDVEVS
jgi:hypothetical protein